MLQSRLAVDSATKLCCLIGDPVIQSPSPGMHNSAFRSTGFNCIYLAFQIPPAAIKDTVKGLRAIGVRGFNVTTPHKEAVTNLVDKLDNVSTDLGAVNTVVNDEGRLFGVNTDVKGFMDPLREKEVILKNRRAVILGAGGAARACVAGLVSEGCSDFVILNRHVDRAEAMVAKMKSKFRFDAKVVKMNGANLRKSISPADIIVNATPVGMYPNVGISPVPKDLIQQDHIVYDLVYKPVKTKLIGYAERAGATIVHGYEMLVEQAAEAFSLWTGIEAPTGVMRRTVMQILGST
jgi:shikimate dehydrogenase